MGLFDNVFDNVDSKSGFGKAEVPYLWDQWAKITCPLITLYGGDSSFLSPELIDRMRRGVLGLGVPQVTAICDAAAARDFYFKKHCETFRNPASSTG